MKCSCKMKAKKNKKADMYMSGGKMKKASMYKDGGKTRPKKAPRRLTPKGPAGMRNKKDVFDLEAPAYISAANKAYSNMSSPMKAEFAGLDAIKKARKKKAMEGMAKSKKLNKSLKRR